MCACLHLKWVCIFGHLTLSINFFTDISILLVSGSTANLQRRRRRLKLILALLVFGAVFATGLLVWCIAKKKKRADETVNRTPMRPYQSAESKTIDNNERYLSDESHEEEEEAKLPLFNFTTIASATKNFAFGCKIGERGFGPVYKVIFCTNCSLPYLVRSFC